MPNDRRSLTATQTLSFQYAQHQAETTRSPRWHKRALELAESPQDTSRALTSYASTLRLRRRFKEALRCADEAIELEPEDGKEQLPRTVRIAVLVDLGRLEQAAEEAKALLQDHPDDSYVVNAANRAFNALHPPSPD